MDDATFLCSIGTDKDDVDHTSSRIELLLVAFLVHCLSFSQQVFSTMQGFDTPSEVFVIYFIT